MKLLDELNIVDSYLLFGCRNKVRMSNNLIYRFQIDDCQILISDRNKKDDRIVDREYDLDGDRIIINIVGFSFSSNRPEPHITSFHSIPGKITFELIKTLANMELNSEEFHRLFKT